MLEKQNATIIQPDQLTTAQVTGQAPLPQEKQTLAYQTLYPLYKANSGLVYPEKLKPKVATPVPLVLTNTAIQVYQENVDLLDPEGFAMIRRNGFGGSDSSVLLGVNPFTKLTDLIKQKASKTITEEELEVGNQTAVMKGNDLEPLVIEKMKQVFEMEVLKPTDMYVFKTWDYLKMNFDGVAGTPEQYFPVEVKIITKKGERHYNPNSCMYDSQKGFGKLPENIAISNNSIETKAAFVGIPPYYYTQLQQEMMALNAPFGYLASLWEDTWTLRVYLCYQDKSVQNGIVVQGFKAWDKVLILRGQ